MTQPYDGFQCAVRLTLSGCLAYAATEHLIVATGPAAQVTIQDPVQALTGTILAAMILVNAVFLAFGARTRVMAMLGLALYTGLVTLVPGLNSLSANSLLAVAMVAVLALPLFYNGGGRFSLSRGGWHVPL